MVAKQGKSEKLTIENVIFAMVSDSVRNSHANL
jgi:hypothetical protein